MRRSSLLLLVIVCLGTFSSKAQSFWTGLNGPYGGTINDLVVHSSGAFIAATNNGVYRSTDSGVTWTRQSLGTDNIFNDLEIDGSGKLYAASNSVRIYTSADAGVTWTQLVSTGLLSFTRKIKVAPNGTTIYVADTGNRIMKSTNSGSTFSTSFSFTSGINDLDVAANNNVYVATSGQAVQVSVD